MSAISDEEMRARLAQSRDYTVVLLRVAPTADLPASRPLIWEHGRRNFSLRAAGVLPIVLRAADDSDWAGVGIFNASPAETERILAEDPAIQAGIFTYELHPVKGFPGDCLPIDPVPPLTTPGGEPS
jgi:hypothetical protein